MAHDVAYQNLLLRRRTELHQRAGTVLEGLHGTHPARLEDLEALCHHFSQGEDRVPGVKRPVPVYGPARTASDVDWSLVTSWAMWPAEGQGAHG